MFAPCLSASFRVFPRLESLEARELLSYTLTDLGAFGHFSAGAIGINDRDQIAIRAVDFDGTTATESALLWHNGRARELPLPDGVTDFHPAALASNGLVAGVAAGDFPFEPVLASRHHSLALAFEGAATSVNRWGDLVGTASHPDGPPTGFLWQHGELTDLGAFNPTAINDAGEIVGNGVWQDGTETDLPLPAGAVRAIATALNQSGSEIVGNVYALSGQAFAGYWDGDGFHFIDGYPQFAPAAVNDAGQIVGRAGLFEHGQVEPMASLMPSGWTNARLTGINDAGVIVGTGQPPAENAHAFVMAPNPLPAPWLGTALMATRHQLP